MIYVLGSNGQLGQSLKKVCGDREVTFLDRSSFDLEKPSTWHLEPGSLYVNAAAYTAVDKAEDESDLAFTINAESMGELSRRLKAIDSKLIHVSTDYVFDGENHKPYVETDLTDPTSVYGRSKLQGEHEVKNNMEDYIIVRTSWVYSEFGANFLKTMKKLGSERKSLTVVFDQVGTPTYAPDLAEVIFKLVDNFENCKGEIYHFSNEGVCSWYDFAREIMEQAKLDCEVSPIEGKDFPTKAKRPFYSVLNKTKIKNKLNIEIPYWKESLRKCLGG